MRLRVDAYEVGAGAFDYEAGEVEVSVGFVGDDEVEE